MTTPSEHERFAIVRVSGKVPDGAVFHGSWPEVMEHIPSTKVIQQKLKIINDAAHVERKLQAKRDALKADRAQLEADKAQLKADHEGFNHDYIQDILRRITDLEVRFAQLEAKQNHDPDADELPTPPGYPGPLPLHERNPPPGTPDIHAMIPDAGELESPTPAKDPEQDSNGEFLRLKPGQQLPHPPVAAGLDGD